MTADDTFQLTDALIAELQTMDTPTVCNALELLVPKRRGYGYHQTPALHASSVTSHGGFGTYCEHSSCTSG